MPSEIVELARDNIENIDQSTFAAGILNAECALAEAIEILSCVDFATANGGWKIEAESSNDVIYTKHIRDGKLFAVRSEITVPLEPYFDDVWHGIGDYASWNSNFEHVRVIAKMGNADVIQYSNKAILTVSSREFLVTRVCRKFNDGYVIAGRSCELDDVPVSKGKVRAHLHLGAARIMPHPSDECKIVIDYLLCTDLKGIVPKMIVNKAMARFLVTDCDETRKRAGEIRRRHLAAAP